MRMLFKIIKWVLITISAIAVAVVLVLLSLYWTRDSRDLSFLESVQTDDTLSVQVVKRDTLQDNLLFFNRSYGNNRLVSTKDGYILLYAEGSPFQIGTAIGKLAPDLVYYQEKVFIERIKELVPSDSYLAFLRIILGVFNRNLASNIPDEYKTEIYAMSRHCTDEFDIIGSPYDRQLNYHAAHDIGHAMQRYMLVGCSSFGVWNDKACGDNLLIGRNFDFYMGDDFAKNKLIMLINPQTGYKYASIAWPGMIGVLSGMNEKGLTITLNAAQGDIPRSSATPVSILAREILQYASNIEEAVAIASKYHTFTSEQFLIGSASDSCCATIEKSPDKMDVVYGEKNLLINTNHFRGKLFESDKWNVENIENSDSRYRYERIEELLDGYDTLAAADVATILRDRFGHSGIDMGYTNQKSVNQLIAHHSVIFAPYTKEFWVSSGKKWQYGKFVHFNLDSLSDNPDSVSNRCNLSDIPEDSLFTADNLETVLEYKQLLNEVLSGSRTVDVERFIALNPNYYNAWVVAGRYKEAFEEYQTALEYYRKALSLEVATEWERREIIHSIGRVEELLKKSSK